MRHSYAIVLAATALLLAGCSAPTPDPEEPIDPQATAAAADAPLELRAAIEEPLDKAKAVEATQAAEEAERQQTLEDTGG
jgi:PBP1b-binding outer membrane lipoprotein LpoB